MKNVTLIFVIALIVSLSCKPKVQELQDTASVPDTAKVRHVFLDVHNLEPGKVTFDAVAGAHQKDLATQGKYGVSFIKYWVDEAAGKVYCLAESPDSVSLYNTHKEAHGLVPDLVHQVSSGEEAIMSANPHLFLDIHQLGAGNVTAAAVADAHKKDLAVQNKYGVNFINYWVDEKLGVVMCLSESKDAASVINTHKEAHGLIPSEIHPVKQGE